MRSMPKIRCLLAAALLSVCSFVNAQNLPAYYPAEGFQRTGQLDAVVLQERRIVVNDITYGLSDNVIVHSLRSFSVPLSQLRPGSTVAFKTVGRGRIVELWILPDNYNRRGRR